MDVFLEVQSQLQPAGEKTLKDSEACGCTGSSHRFSVRTLIALGPTGLGAHRLGPPTWNLDKHSLHWGLLGSYGLGAYRLGNMAWKLGEHWAGAYSPETYHLGGSGT